VTVRLAPVALFVSVTVAPATTLPCGSVIVPDTMLLCPNAATAAKLTNAAVSRLCHNLL
jgi:hypothetical protein